MTVSRFAFFLCTTAAITSFAVAQQQSGFADPDSVFLQSVSLQRAGQYAEARAMLRNLLNHFPQYHDARLLYGRLLAWDSRYSEALIQIDSVLFFLPTNTEARFTKAQILAWSTRYRPAADILLALSQEDPDSPVYPAELGKIYLWGGSPRKALEEYEKAYLKDPSSGDVIRGLARVHRRLRSFDLSRFWYEKVLERFPGDPEAQTEILRLSYRSDVEIQLQGSYEAFTSGGLKAHSIGQLEVYASPTEDLKPFVHLSRVSKYSREENRFGAGSYVTLDYALSFLAQAIVSPRAKVAPSLDLLAELSWAVGDGFEVIGGYRYMKFDSVRVHILQPGLTWYLNSDTWLTVKEYVGFPSMGSTSNSTVAALYYSWDQLNVLRLGGFTGTEAFRATTLGELSSLTASGVFAGIKSRVSKSLAVEMLYQFTSRNTVPNSHLVAATLTVLF